MNMKYFIFSPKLFKEYGDNLQQKLYEPIGLEKWGDQIIYTLSLMWNIGYYTSPLIATFLYRRGVTESITSMCKISTGIGILVIISFCMRGIGRSQSKVYSKFVKALETSKANPQSIEAKRAIRLFDFEFKSWPIDFTAKHNNEIVILKSSRTNPLISSSLPCEIAAYIAIHTFGIRMIYPGSVKLIQSYLHPVLVEGRSKLVEENNGQRFKLQTSHGNYVDSMFIDNRKKNSPNGSILVLCSEGNAGFYEIGLMTTPLALNYSVLGWNHPGFGGSTGNPYPADEHAAIDTVVQFAINRLGFLPENILLFGWSIGGYSSLVAASQYPQIKGVILDATFDDLLHLALPRMPEILSGIVKTAIRQYINLHNTKLINLYNGPVKLIRRTEDEVISENMDISKNRGNFLLVSMLKYRFPHIFGIEQINHVSQMLSNLITDTKTTTIRNNDRLCESLILSYVSEHGRCYPLKIGEDYTLEQKNQMAEYLVYKHMIDFKSSHCVPLPTDYFQLPWSLPDDTNDFVIT